MKTKILLSLISLSALANYPPIFTPTTEELIQELSKYPPDVQVFIQDENGDLRIITSVELRALDAFERNIVVIH